MSRYDGGPAFAHPKLAHNGTFFADPDGPGLSVRQYYKAHAPIDWGDAMQVLLDLHGLKKGAGRGDRRRGDGDAGRAAGEVRRLPARRGRRIRRGREASEPSVKQAQKPPGIPFGDPRHPYHQTTEMARKAAQANRGKTPWRKWIDRRKQ